VNRVAEIHRYPVKSMLGERLTGTELTELGIPGDRAWALKDEARGALTGAKRFPQLMSMSARFATPPDAGNRSPEVIIRIGATHSVSSHAAEVNDRLSDAVGHPVSLWPLLPAERDDHYRRESPTPGRDPAAALRAVFARTADEPLPDVSRFPAVLATHHTPPGTYFDAYPLLIISRSALTALAEGAAAAGFDAAFDLRRFRPNLVLDCDQDGFVEDAWTGRTLRIGEAELQVDMACPRCIMTTHGFLEVPRDPKIMRALVQVNGGNLGVYANVTRPGQVRVGDAVHVV
jgi:uncharacterized protein